MQPACSDALTAYGIVIGPASVLDPSPVPGQWAVSGTARRYDAPASGLTAHPDHSWVQVVDVGGTAVKIVTAERRTTEEIAASVR